jgi:hypothetical protein
MSSGRRGGEPAASGSSGESQPDISETEFEQAQARRRGDGVAAGRRAVKRRRCGRRHADRQPRRRRQTIVGCRADGTRCRHLIRIKILQAWLQPSVFKD